LRFPTEALQPHGLVGRVAREKFERDAPIQARVFSSIHFPHPTRAERVEDAIVQ
jgi:hypothetical protein